LREIKRGIEKGRLEHSKQTETDVEGWKRQKEIARGQRRQTDNETD